MGSLLGGMTPRPRDAWGKREAPLRTIVVLLSWITAACSGGATSPEPASGPAGNPQHVADPPAVARSDPASPPSSVVPAQPAAGPAPSPSAPRTLATLLPAPAPPITLAHARALARAADYAGAAAIYDALLEREPDNARYLAGRGYCLILIDGAGELARADLQRARTLAGADERLLALIDHNLELLSQRLGAREEPECRDRAEPVVGTPAATLVDVVAAIVASLPDEWRDVGPPLPTTEAEALTLLCAEEACDPTRRFTSTLAPDGHLATHLVFPVPNGGYRVVANVTGVGVWDARCGASIERLEIVESDGRIVVRSNVSHSEEFEECDGDECATGCAFSGREDVVTVVRADGSRAVRVTIMDRPDGSPVADVPLRFEERGIVVTVCEREQRLPF